MAESQAAEEARRRNPVKLGIWIAAFCVIVVGICSLNMQLIFTSPISAWPVSTPNGTAREASKPNTIW